MSARLIKLLKKFYPNKPIKILQKRPRAPLEYPEVVMATPEPRDPESAASVFIPKRYVEQFKKELSSIGRTNGTKIATEEDVDALGSTFIVRVTGSDESRVNSSIAAVTQWASRCLL